MKNNKLRALLIISIISTLCGVVLGFIVGKSQTNVLESAPSNRELAKSQEVNQNVTNFYQELSGGIKGIHKGIQSEIFDSNVIHINSPLLKGKNIASYSYQFKGDLIIERNLDLGNGITLYIAEYHPNKNSTLAVESSGFPTNFVTFQGYENYSLTPSYVGPRVMMWDDGAQYTPRINSEYDQQQIYYEEVEYEPIQFGTAALTTYVRYFQGIKEANYPALISVKKSLDGPVYSKDDLIFRQAIDDLKPIVDSITYGNIQ